MRIKKNILFAFILSFILIATLSCKKEQAPLELAKDYLFVADVQQYCQGNCDETSDWENQSILTKGHVMGIENDSLMQDYFDNDLFYLKDIRNGVFIEIRIKGDKAGIFNKLSGGQKTDMLLLKGKAEAVTASSGQDCTKGVVIGLFTANDIWFE
ncbi:MAG: hypothetical protein DRJ05_14585 [Bacteroidetes bacterium]|nr:MAG: hypothetical protein DRJ05_14585 [Bacteroidota bacterium]